MKCMKSIGIVGDNEPMQSQVSCLISALLLAAQSNQLFSETGGMAATEVGATTKHTERGTLLELNRSLSQEGNW